MTSSLRLPYTCITILSNNKFSHPKTELVTYKATWTRGFPFRNSAKISNLNTIPVVYVQLLTVYDGIRVKSIQEEIYVII